MHIELPIDALEVEPHPVFAHVQHPPDNLIAAALAKCLENLDLSRRQENMLAACDHLSGRAESTDEPLSARVGALWFRSESRQRQGERWAHRMKEDLPGAQPDPKLHRPSQLGFGTFLTAIEQKRREEYTVAEARPRQL